MTDKEIREIHKKTKKFELDIYRTVFDEMLKNESIDVKKTKDLMHRFGISMDNFLYEFDKVFNSRNQQAS